MLFFNIDFFALWSQIWRVCGSKIAAKFAPWAPLELHDTHFGDPFGSLGSVIAHFGTNYEENGAPRLYQGGVLEVQDPIWRLWKWNNLIWQWINLFWH